MSDATPLLLGLHRLVDAEDGRVPELLAAQTISIAVRGTERCEWPAKAPVAKGRQISTRPASNDNVVPFQPYLLARMRRRS